MPGPVKSLTPVQKQHWNAFVDYMGNQNLKGNAILDQRDKSIGQQAFLRFKAANPGVSLKYEDVPVVQKELQDYRSDLVNKYKSGQAKVDGVKNEDEIMPGLSDVDGWIGSKTSSHKFPVASFTSAKGEKTDYGTNTKLYDAMMASLKGGK